MTNGPALLLGVGNPFRRDDGIGPALVARLGPRLATGCRGVVERGDDISRLIAAWEGIAVACVVDAALSADPPGTLRVHDARGWTAGSHDPSSHGFGLAEAIALSRTLGTLPPAFHVVSVAGADFGHGEGLSPTLAARLDAIAMQVAAALPPGILRREEASGCTKHR